MQEFDLQVKLLNACGVKRYPSRGMKIFYGFMILWYLFINLYCAFSSLALLRHSEDIFQIFEILARIPAAIVMNKLVVIYWNKDKFFSVMDEIRMLNEKWIKIPHHRTIIFKANEISQKFTIAITMTSVIAVISYCLKPILNDFLSKWILNTQPSYEHPFEGEHFFDAKSTPGYEIIYLMQISMFYMIAFSSGATSGLFCTYTLNISAHFSILQEIVNDTDFEDFVIYHRKLTQLTQKLLKIYRPIIFVEYLSIAVSICFTGIQIIMLSDFVQILTAVLHSLTAVADVFIYAYGAQRVLDSALEVFDNFKKIDKRYLVPIIISQKKLIFDARLFNSSLYTLSAMLSRATSFVTLLKSMV